MSSDKNNYEFVNSLARGLDVLQVFSRERPELTLSEVAAIAGLTPATARRFLHTLHSLGYIAVNGRRFLLTSRVLNLSAPFLSSMNLQEVAQQFLQDVVMETGDSSSVTILDGTDVVYIATVSSKRAARLTVNVGMRYPAYATSTGRILLANLEPAKQNAVLAETKFKKLTENTVTDATEFGKILAVVKQEGVAVVEDELEYGVLSVSVPISIDHGKVIAAINCSTSPSRIKRADMTASRVPILRDAARKISDALRQYPALVHSILAED